MSPLGAVSDKHGRHCRDTATHAVTREKYAETYPTVRGVYMTRERVTVRRRRSGGHKRLNEQRRVEIEGGGKVEDTKREDDNAARIEEHVYTGQQH